MNCVAINQDMPATIQAIDWLTPIAIAALPLSSEREPSVEAGPPELVVAVALGLLLLEVELVVVVLGPDLQ
jgi:hypothetical protein